MYIFTAKTERRKELYHLVIGYGKTVWFNILPLLHLNSAICAIATCKGPHPLSTNMGPVRVPNSIPTFYAPGDDSPHGGILLLFCSYVRMYVYMCNMCHRNIQSLSIYIDLFKAFDTINHSILLSKLIYYGTRGKPLEWFIASRESSMLCTTEYGVPQGSVLGPLLCILYYVFFNMPNSLTYCQAILFVDDTTVYLTGDNLQTTHDKVNTDLYILNDLFRANQLSVNPSKTKYIIVVKFGNILTNGMLLHIDN